MQLDINSYNIEGLNKDLRQPPHYKDTFKKYTAEAKKQNNPTYKNFDLGRPG